MRQSLTAAEPVAELALTGDVARPARLTVPDLLDWPQHTARVSFECATSGVQEHSFAGPLLHDVLHDAGPGFDPARRKDRLRFLIAVTGADGHHALLSWAEIDPDFGRAPVLLAVTIDDTPSTGPDPSWSCPRTAAGRGTSAASTRSEWTAATRRGRDRVGAPPAHRTPDGDAPWRGTPVSGLDGSHLSRHGKVRFDRSSSSRGS